MICSMTLVELTLTVYNSISSLSCKILKRCLSCGINRQVWSTVFTERQKIFDTINSTETSKLKQMFLSLVQFAKKQADGC